MRRCGNLQSNHNSPRSYTVCTPDGKTYRRNRKYLLKTQEKTFPAMILDSFDVSSPTTADEHSESIIQSIVSSPAALPDTHKENIQPVQGKIARTTRYGREIKAPRRRLYLGQGIRRLQHGLVVNTRSQQGYVFFVLIT